MNGRCDITSGEQLLCTPLMQARCEPPVHGSKGCAFCNASGSQCVRHTLLHALRECRDGEWGQRNAVTVGWCAEQRCALCGSNGCALCNASGPQSVRHPPPLRPWVVLRPHTFRWNHSRKVQGGACVGELHPRGIWIALLIGPLPLAGGEKDRWRVIRECMGGQGYSNPHARGRKSTLP